MANWDVSDADWQGRKQQMDAEEGAGEYAAMLALEDEAVAQAVLKSLDLAWEAAKPVVSRYAEAMAKAIIAELSEAPPVALDIVASRLGVELDKERLIKDLARYSVDHHLDVADAVSQAVYEAVLDALGGNE